MFIGLWMLTGIICFLLLEVRTVLSVTIGEDLDLIDYAGGIAFAVGGYMVAWPYCLFNVVFGEEIDESEED